MPWNWTGTNEIVLAVFTIYDHPLDHPDGFLVRRWVVTNGEPLPREWRKAATLEEARTLLPPGLHCLGRNPDDDPKIVESWI
jgi:hypothetical protein